MLRQNNALPAVALIVALTLLSACRTLPIDGRLPDGLAAEKITSVDEASPFALSPDGNVVALVSSGLKMFHLGLKEQIDISVEIPKKLAWSPSGNFLAAVYRKEQKSTIITYDQYGVRIAETTMDSELTDLFWISENELLAGGITVKNYKFGSNYKSVFYRWKPGQDVPVAYDLRDTTIQPSTFNKWKTALERGPMLEPVGQSAQILYLHPVDPPLFTPYYKLIIRDLDTGKELEPANVSINSGGGSFAADGESLLFGDGTGSTKLYNPWTEDILQSITTPGRNPALSPDGFTWFADGTLFSNSKMVAPLAPGVALFAPDGSRLLLRSGESLYLLTGLKPAEGSLFVPSIAEKIQKLRSMRLQGLLTPAEYRETMKKIIAP